MNLLKWKVKISVSFILFLSIFCETIARQVGDVTEDDVVIDQIEEYLRDNTLQNAKEVSRRRMQLQDSYPRHFDSSGNQDSQNNALEPENIEFAVRPRDARYNMPAHFFRDEKNRPEHYKYKGQDPAGYQYYANDFYDLRHAPLNYEYAPYNYYSLPDYNYGGAEEIPAKNAAPDPRFYLKDPTYQNSQDAKWVPEHQEMRTSQPESVNYLQQAQQFVNSPGAYKDLNQRKSEQVDALSDFYFVSLVAGCTVVAVSVVVGAGLCYYKLNKSKKEAADAEYPAYGVTGPSKDLSPGAGDRKLAQSAHMYHYQHQKQQMIAVEKSSGDDRHCSASDVDSEDEEVPDYTVYECPGLAPTDNMEVKNPLFSDDPTPASPAVTDIRNETKDDA